MKAEIVSIEAEVHDDECPDASYLYQENMDWEERREAYERGDFGFLGVRLVAKIAIKSDQGYSVIGNEIGTPGLWGIESDSGSDYLESVAQDEEHVLIEMLRALGFKKKTIRRALEQRPKL